MKIVLGTAQFGSAYGIANKTGIVSEKDIKKILNFAYQSNINMIDTAMDYGDSENRLGKNNLNKFNLITKLSSLNLNVENIQNEIKFKVKRSLDNLKVNKLYGLLLHRPEQLLSIKGDQIIEAILCLKSSGLISQIGISIYSPEILESLISKLKIDLIQVPYNILDNRIDCSGWLDKLRDLNIEIHARSIFLQGLLLMKYDKLPKDYFRNHQDLIDWYEWQKNNSEADPYETCLKYVLDNPKIDKVLVGVDNIFQMMQLVETVKSKNKFSFPRIRCKDEKLINPYFWNKL